MTTPTAARARRISALDESGCTAGAHLVNDNPGAPNGSISSGGDCGGFDCFSLVP